MVQQTVEDGRGGHLVAEDSAPLGHGLVGGHQQAPLLVTTGDELVEQVRAALLEGVLAELVDEQAVRDEEEDREEDQPDEALRAVGDTPRRLDLLPTKPLPRSDD